MPEHVVDTLREIARLRRLDRRLDESVQLDRTVSLLLGTIGPTVKRSVAARALGVSQTALDKWVTKGEIATVDTPSGRPEVPTEEVIELLEQLDESTGARPLTEAIRRRRLQATQGLDLLPWQLDRPTGHRSAELRALAYHRAVAKKLTQAGVRDAKRRLDAWTTAGRIDEHWAREWERILALPVDEIATLIGEDSPTAADLRQVSPFAGSLSDYERRRILAAMEL